MTRGFVADSDYESLLEASQFVYIRKAARDKISCVEEIYH